MSGQQVLRFSATAVPQAENPNNPRRSASGRQGLGARMPRRVSSSRNAVWLPARMFRRTAVQRGRLCRRSTHRHVNPTRLRAEPSPSAPHGRTLRRVPPRPRPTSPDSPPSPTEYRTALPLAVPLIHPLPRIANPLYAKGSADVHSGTAAVSLPLCTSQYALVGQPPLHSSRTQETRRFSSLLACLATQSRLARSVKCPTLSSLLSALAGGAGR